MKYPSGIQVKVGDWIWWNEGCALGRIALIIDSESKIYEYGLSECGVFICNDLINDYMTSDIFYPEKSFADEGVEPLSNKEKSYFMAKIKDELNKQDFFNNGSKIIVRIDNINKKLKINII